MTAISPAHDRTLAGIGLMLTGIFFFALNDALNSPAAVGLFHKLNLQPEPGSPSQAASFIHSESGVWGDVIVKAHIQPH